jgi:hypothetical protein
MSTPFIETRCGQNFHSFAKVDGKLAALHSDNQECLDAEFRLPLEIEEEGDRCRECGSTEAGGCFYCKAD